MPTLEAWISPALRSIATALEDDPFWGNGRRGVCDRASEVGVHLAVLVEPFLSYVLDGSKTIESRFATRRFAPYNKVRTEDIVLLKASSGPVVGVCTVGRTWYYQLSGKRMNMIRDEFGQKMRADTPDFWEKRQAAAFASLLEVRQARQLPQPLSCPKRDRRGWVVLKSPPRKVRPLFA